MEYKLGRDYDSPVSVPAGATSVSGDHASIFVEDGGWKLVDNGSRNGTFVEQNGNFVRIKSVGITPDTWIRLGGEGVYGFMFKARRVVSPNSFMDDFTLLKQQLQNCEEAEQKVSTLTSISKFVGPLVSAACLIATMFPPLNTNFGFYRAAMLLPGIATLLVGMWLGGKSKAAKQERRHMVCPRCRRPLSEYDINNRQCSICKAH